MRYRRARFRAAARYCVALRGFAALAAVVLLAHGGVRAAVAAEQRPPAIEVTAEAQVEAPPDLAVVAFGVTTQATVAADAARQNAQRMDAVLAAVRKLLGPQAQIGTGNYSLHPNQTVPRDGSPPRVTGYTASNVVQLKTRELTRLGEIVDAAIKAGANNVQRITFTLADDDAPRREALRRAVAKALEEVATIAAALRVQTGAVHSLVEHDAGGARPLMRQAAAMYAESAAPTPIEPGRIEVRARVTLTVEIAR